LSGRVVGIVALKNYLAVDCELKPLDLGRGDQRAPEYVSLNPNRKTPTLEDDGIVRWESNQSTSVRISAEGIAVLLPSELGSERRAERAQERMDRARHQRNCPVDSRCVPCLVATPMHALVLQALEEALCTKRRQLVPARA